MKVVRIFVEFVELEVVSLVENVLVIVEELLPVDVLELEDVLLFVDVILIEVVLGGFFVEVIVEDVEVIVEVKVVFRLVGLGEESVEVELNEGCAVEVLGAVV